MGLLNPGGPIAQFKRNRCSISPVELILQSGVRIFEEHRQEITIHKAAKQAFDELQITKLPSMQSLYEEFHQLAVQKKQDYAEYRQIRKEKEELLIAKRTVETILNIDKQKEQEKEQEKEEKKNFR